MSTILTCSFCNKSQHDVQRLIAGPPGIQICNECVKVCTSVIAHEERKHLDTSQSSSNVDVENLPTPKDIKRALDDAIIEQVNHDRVDDCSQRSSQVENKGCVEHRVGW